MEYLIGAVVMLVALNAINRYVSMRASDYRMAKPLISQSRSFEMTRLFSITVPKIPKPIETQATKHFDKSHLRVVIFENKAYWIMNNALYEADIIDGNIDRNSTKIVDTMALDKVELDKMVLIVEQLTGGNNSDSGYSGNTQF